MKAKIEHDTMVKDNGDVVLGSNSADAILDSVFKEGDKVKIVYSKGSVLFEKEKPYFKTPNANDLIYYLCGNCEMLYKTNKKKCNRCGCRAFFAVTRDNNNRIIYLE